MISMDRTIACTCCWLARICWNIGYVYTTRPDLCRYLYLEL